MTDKELNKEKIPAVISSSVSGGTQSAEGGETPAVHKRRKRYSGKYPRHFAEKYKELLEETIKPKEVRIVDVFPGSGINVGPGLMAAYYMGKPISEELKEEKELINNLINSAE